MSGAAPALKYSTIMYSMFVSQQQPHVEQIEVLAVDADLASQRSLHHEAFLAIQRNAPCVVGSNAQCNFSDRRDGARPVDQRIHQQRADAPAPVRAPHRNRELAVMPHALPPTGTE